jgi:gamma-glutamylcyclotransferase (GGCT)/AIG2-like uncharacterized protein YtfP
MGTRILLITGSFMDQEHLPVFVYGTLRPGQKNYARHLQGKTVREAPASCAGLLFVLPEEGYPYLLPGRGTVQGELLFLAPAIYEQTLRRLDVLEEYDPGSEATSAYLRRRATVRLAGGEEYQAWVYYWNRSPAGELVVSGDFLDSCLATGDS